jgi:hypothetical protein
VAPVPVTWLVSEDIYRDPQVLSVSLGISRGEEGKTEKEKGKAQTFHCAGVLSLHGTERNGP